MPDKELPPKTISEPQSTQHDTNKPTKETDTAKPEMPLPPAPIGPDRKEAPHHCEITCKTEKDWWDKWKKWVEIAGVLLLAVYTLYTIKMYCANKKAANAATEAANTAKNAFEIGSQSSIVIKNVQKIKASTPFCFHDGRICAEIWFIAAGTTPARGVHTTLHITKNLDRNTVESMPPPKRSGPYDFAPMSVGEHKWAAVSEEHFTADDSKIMDGKVGLYGATQYYDIFGGYHVTRFCFSQVPPLECEGKDRTGCFSTCDYGNWLDNPKDVSSY